MTRSQCDEALAGLFIIGPMSWIDGCATIGSAPLDSTAQALPVRDPTRRVTQHQRRSAHRRRRHIDSPEFSMVCGLASILGGPRLRVLSVLVWLGDAGDGSRGRRVGERRTGAPNPWAPIWESSEAGDSRDRLALRRRGLHVRPRDKWDRRVRRARAPALAPALVRALWDLCR